MRAKVIMTKKGEVIKLTKAEKEQWRKDMKPVWAKYEPEIGKDLMDAAIQVNGKHAAK